jgi:hypothetical protein
MDTAFAGDAPTTLVSAPASTAVTAAASRLTVGLLAVIATSRGSSRRGRTGLDLRA